MLSKYLDDPREFIKCRSHKLLPSTNIHNSKVLENCITRERRCSKHSRVSGARSVTTLRPRRKHRTRSDRTPPESVRIPASILREDEEFGRRVWLRAAQKDSTHAYPARPAPGKEVETIASFGLDIQQDWKYSQRLYKDDYLLDTPQERKQVLKNLRPQTQSTSQ